MVLKDLLNFQAVKNCWLKVLSAMQSVPTSLVRVLNGVIDQIIGCLKGY